MQLRELVICDEGIHAIHSAKWV